MIEYILEQYEAWSHLGKKTNAEGSFIIGHIPRDFPEAYLHYFFAPLSEIKWQEYGLELPLHLSELYSECNGLDIFGHLAIYGIREHFRRDASAQFQPFDLKTHNQEFKETDCPLEKDILDTRICFGSYFWDGSKLYTTAETPFVYRCVDGDPTAINTWPDIETFLHEEYDRLNLLFTKDGYLIDDSIPTHPIMEKA